MARIDCTLHTFRQKGDHLAHPEQEGNSRSNHLTRSKYVILETFFNPSNDPD